MNGMSPINPIWGFEFEKISQWRVKELGCEIEIAPETFHSQHKQFMYFRLLSSATDQSRVLFFFSSFSLFCWWMHQLVLNASWKGTKCNGSSSRQQKIIILELKIISQFKENLWTSPKTLNDRSNDDDESARKERWQEQRIRFTNRDKISREKLNAFLSPWTALLRCSLAVCPSKVYRIIVCEILLCCCCCFFLVNSIENSKKEKDAGEAKYQKKYSSRLTIVKTWDFRPHRWCCIYDKNFIMFSFRYAMSISHLHIVRIARTSTLLLSFPLPILFSHRLFLFMSMLRFKQLATT